MHNPVIFSMSQPHWRHFIPQHHRCLLLTTTIWGQSWSNYSVFHKKKAKIKDKSKFLKESFVLYLIFSPIDHFMTPQIYTVTLWRGLIPEFGFVSQNCDMWLLWWLNLCLERVNHRGVMTEFLKQVEILLGMCKNKYSLKATFLVWS